MLSVNWKPPRFVVAKRRPNGRIDFFFLVPAGQRPHAWAPSIRLPHDVALRTRDGSPAELRAVEADAEKLNAQIDEIRTGVKKGDTPGSLPWLIARWQIDDRYGYATLSKGTMRQYDMAVRRLLLWHRMQPFETVSEIRWPHIVRFLDAFRDRKGTSALVRTVLKQLFDVGKDFGYCEVNPFIGEEKRVSRRSIVKRDPFKRWTFERVEKAVALCDLKGSPSIGTAILVGFDMMQYPAQIIAMRRGHEYRPPFFVYERNKTGEDGVVKASQRVQDRLSGAGLYLFINEHTGRPWLRDAFVKRFREIMDADPETHGLEFRHLRHCGAMEARRAGASWDDIATTGAWKTVRSAEAAISPVIDMFYRLPDFEGASASMEKREALRAAGGGVPREPVVVPFKNGE